MKAMMTSVLLWISIRGVYRRTQFYVIFIKYISLHNIFVVDV